MRKVYIRDHHAPRCAVGDDFDEDITQQLQHIDADANGAILLYAIARQCARFKLHLAKAQRIALAQRDLIAELTALENLATDVANRIVTSVALELRGADAPQP